MRAEHGLHHGLVIGNGYVVGVKAVEVFSRIRPGVSCDDDFDVSREGLGQPEGDVTFLSVVFIQEAVDSLKDQHDLVIKNIEVLDGLILDALIADIQPIGKVLSQLFIMELDFLVDVEFFS